MASIFQFRYATGFDVLLMTLGTLGAIAHGISLPLLLVIFGDMTDLFINADNNFDSLNQTELLAEGCNWTQFGYTWEQIAPPDGDFDALK